MIPKFITRSAKPGEPSVLWIGKSGRSYRTLVAAKKDKEADAWSAKPQAVSVTNKKNTLLIVLVIMALAAIGYKFLKK